MGWKSFINDLKRNPWKHLILFGMMTLSMMLSVLVCFILVQLYTSLSDLYETAKPPHFLQMHKGELRQEDIDAFNRSYAGMKYWQTVPMLDVYGDELTIEGSMEGSLSECRLDISLVRQNEEYDLLLDADRKVLHMKQGEIGVPVILLEQYPIELGDRIWLESGEIKRCFTVAAYVYDSQMNSTLCSSTRFLISDEDFEELFGRIGETEYLIEAYFEDSAMAAAYQTAYEQNRTELPKNGQAVTYTMIFLLSAMTDLMMAMVLVLVGILLLAVAMLCLRFIILASLEEDTREIGTMKAMGIPFSGIRRQYLSRFRILLILSCLAGYGLAWPVSGIFFRHMEHTFGRQPLSVPRMAAAALVCAVVFGWIQWLAGQLLNRIRKVTVVDSLVRERGFGREWSVRDGMHRAEKLPVNLLFSLREARRGYGIIFGLLFLVSLLMVIPCLMVHTMEDEQFVTYMGSVVCDVMLEVEPGEGLEQRREKAKQLLDMEEADYLVSRRVRLQALNAKGEVCGIHVDTGERSGVGLQYLVGCAPGGERELALSALMADELGKETGDSVTILQNGAGEEFKVSGVYQDVTSGGRTAKACHEFGETEAEQYTYIIDLTGGQDKEEVTERFRAVLGNGYSVEEMETFLEQTLGGVTAQLKQASWMAYGIGSLLILLVAGLFQQLRIAREGGMFAIKRALGIGWRDIYRQELYPVLIHGAFGSFSGILFAVTVGDQAAGLVFAGLGLGIERLEFAVQPFVVWAVIPASLLLLLTGVVWISCRQIRGMDVTDYLNE
ncbi:MAG: ABC transporter permease [Lachnospiraceae bacterium]|nr:ABC transporter permease [Lachnospiraceae bacterium]